MSAFLVENTTIHKIIMVVKQQIRSSSRFRDELSGKLGRDFRDFHWETKLGQKMLDLNQLALGYRYGDAMQMLTYEFAPHPCTPVQSYKALQCWLYQCCEGDIPRRSKLYKVFDEFVLPSVANAIITSSQEYDEAEWG